MSLNTQSTDILGNEISPFLTLGSMNPPTYDEVSGNKGSCQADENSDLLNSYSAADQVISYNTEDSLTSDDSYQLPISAETVSGSSQLMSDEQGSPGLINMANKPMIYSGEFAKAPCSTINKTISDYCLKLSKEPKQVCIPTRLLYQNNSILKLKPIRDASSEGNVSTLVPNAPVIRLQKVASLNTKSAINSQGPQNLKHTPAILGGKKEKPNVVKTLLLKSILPSTIKMVAKRVSISGFSAVTPSSGIYSVAETHTQKSEVLSSSAPKMTPLVLPTSQSEVKHLEILPASNISVKQCTSIPEQQVGAHQNMLHEGSSSSVPQQASSTEGIRSITHATTPSSNKGQRKRNVIAPKVYEESRCEDITNTKTTIAFVLTTRKHRKILPKEETDEKPQENIAVPNGKAEKVLWTREVKFQQRKEVLKSGSFDCTDVSNISPSNGGNDGSMSAVEAASGVVAPPLLRAGASLHLPSIPSDTTSSPEVDNRYSNNLVADNDRDKVAMLPYNSTANKTVPYSHLSPQSFGNYNQGNVLSNPENETRWCSASSEWGYTSDMSTQGHSSPDQGGLTSVSNYKTQLMQYLQETIPTGDEKPPQKELKVPATKGNKPGPKGCGRGRRKGKACAVKLERERPYICCFCGKSEQYKAILQRHLMLHHKISVPSNK